MNETLGGLFSSRINLNLREDNGYTYGASTRSSCSAGRPARSLSAPASAPTSPAPAVTEIFNEIRRHEGRRSAPTS